MSDDYLWDGSGEPDPEVQRLEQLLVRFRHDPAKRAPAVPPPLRNPWPRRAAWLSLAAAVLLAAFLGLRFYMSAAAGWEVLPLEGAPTVGSEALRASGRMRAGEWLATDANSRARIRIGAIGETEVDANSRVRLVRAKDDGHRMALAVGTIHAVIWAPPGLFAVETPSATAVDLGCAYTLTVDESGAALLSVTSGWVAWDRGQLETFVPAGAECATKPKFGPGTPYFEDATPAFREALERVDFGAEADAARLRALATVLAEARARDGLTLWHLLSRVPGDERGAVYDRLAALVPPPAAATRDAVIAGDRELLDQWWDELELGSSGWWRLWKRPEAPGER